MASPLGPCVVAAAGGRNHHQAQAQGVNVARRLIWGGSEASGTAAGGPLRTRCSQFGKGAACV